MKKTYEKKEKDPLSSVREAQSDLKANCERSGNSLKGATAVKHGVCREVFNFILLRFAPQSFLMGLPAPYGAGGPLAPQAGVRFAPQSFSRGLRVAPRHGAACSASGRALARMSCGQLFLFSFFLKNEA